MRRILRKFSRRSLEHRFRNFMFMRVLLRDGWFQVVFLLLFFGILAGGLMLPKIWRVSPDGFLPIIKASGLDLLQARSLRKSAEAAEKAGRIDDAFMSWQTALANNRADPALARGSLRTLLQTADPKKHALTALEQSLWLLRLGKTNLADLELAADVLEKFRALPLLTSALEASQPRFTPKLQATYLRFLFHESRFDEFGRRWAQAAPDVKNDPTLALYFAAYQAGWGDPSQQREADQALSRARDDLPSRILAHQLTLKVDRQRQDAARYGEHLEKLQSWGGDTLEDHLAYWQMLKERGELAKARSLARESTKTPETALEFVKWVALLDELSLGDFASEMFESYEPRFAHTQQFWIAWAGHLIEKRKWEELRRAAVKLRAQEILGPELLGFADFLEGRALAGLNQFEAARQMYQRAVAGPFNNEALMISTAGELITLGQAALARDLLLRYRPAVPSLPYWLNLVRAADALKDAELLLTAAQGAYRLAPRDPGIINFYAAALLVNRREPQEAVKLTLLLLSHFTNSIAARINHAGALLMNQRFEEAEKMFQGAPTNSLSPEQLAAYHFDLFDLCMAQSKREQALGLARRIHPDYLYNNQRRRLAEALQQLDAKSQAN